MSVINKRVWVSQVNRIVLYFCIFILVFSVTNALSDENQANNIMNVSVDVIDTEVLGVYFVHYAENSSSRLNNDYSKLVSDQSSFLSGVFPIKDSAPLFVRPENNPVTIEDLKKRINMTPGNNYWFDLLKHLDIQSRLAGNERVVGIVSQQFSDDYAGGEVGFASRNGDIKSVIVVEKQSSIDYKETSAAHEIGHIYKFCDEYSETIFQSRDDNKTINKGGCPNGD